MGFFTSLLSADGEISSKRFAGLCLVGQFIISSVIISILGDVSAPVESLLKVGLYTGGGLLGFSMAKEVIETVKRPAPVIEKKEDEDK